MIYRRIPVFILPFAVLLLVISCDQQGRRSTFSAENNIAFDTIRLTAHHHLDKDTLNPYCDIRVEFVFPVTNGNMNKDALQQFFIRNVFGVPYDTLAPSDAVQKYMENYVRNYIADAKTYREGADEMSKLKNLGYGFDASENDHPAEDIFYSYHESLSDSIVYNRYGVLSFQVKQSNNKGGVASYDSYRNFVLNLQTGKQVTESDIFNAGYETVLQRLIIASFLEQANEMSVSELEEIGFFGIREIVPNQNFLLNDKGIIYTYNKGEYSAYQLDAPQVFIPYEAILSLLKDNSIASKLSKLQ